jgi:hypothetical protein
MRRVPRGHPAGHPRAHLFRHRSLIVTREFEAEAVRDVEPVYRTCDLPFGFASGNVSRGVLGAVSERLISSESQRRLCRHRAQLTNMTPA